MLLRDETNFGIRTRVYYDESTDALQYHRSQDSSAILKANKESRSENLQWKEGIPNLVASFPPVLVYQWISEGKIPADYTVKDLMKMANSYEYSNLKVR